MKDKSKVLKMYGYMFDKLQFVGLIGGRLCIPVSVIPIAS